MCRRTMDEQKLPSSDMDLLKQGIEVYSEQVELWLDENRQWSEDYFRRKATVEFVLKWIHLHENTCKMHGIYTKKPDACIEDLLNNNKNISGDKIDDISALEDDVLENADETLLHYQGRFSRRFSEPVTSSRDLNKKGFRLRRNHSLQSQIHATIPEDETKDVQLRKHSADSHFLGKSATDTTCAPIVRQRHRSIAQLGSLIESRIKLPSRKSLDQGKKLNLKHNNEDDFFYEIIKDIANNLNLKTLSYNILVNIGILTNADRCSLFLVEGPKNRRSLVSELFDVHPIRLRTNTDQSGFVIRVPWGKGIVGYAAETGQTVNIHDAYADSRFNQDVDKQTGYRTKSLLCTPIKNSDGEVVGVAQLINKNPDASAFTNEDQELCNRYLPFCGIGIANAQLFELSQKEFQRNKVLIEMIHDIFEEQTSISRVVNRVMKRSLKLMKCEHCSVMLLNEPLVESEDGQFTDRNSENLKFSNNFHLKAATSGRHSVIPSEINGELLNALTALSERVVSNPKTLCTSDINEDANIRNLAGRSCEDIKTVISMPIRNSKSEILGVASLMNKVNNSPFDENDISLFEAIVLFCGLGINNTMLYDQMAKAKAKQQVALEVLSYHVKCPQMEVEKLKLSLIPSQSSVNLSSMKFDDFSLDPDQMLTASVRMFIDCGLIEEFNIDYQTLCWWLTTTRKNYRNVIYHNWRHAFNVAQSMFAILTTGNMKQHLSKLECLALLAGCLCHDVDHRGTNNAFQAKTASPLATLYGTSVMEHHHFNHTIMILNAEGHNIFQNLSSQSYRKVVSLLRHSILSTDLAINFKYRSAFFPLVENDELNLENEEHRSMLRAMMMTACDLCGITKPWKTQREVVNLVTSEFIQQGDIEREKFNENDIPAMMDRQKKNELPRMQVQFFDNVGIPIFRICAKVNPLLKPLLHGAIENRNRWEQLQNAALLAEV